MYVDLTWRSQTAHSGTQGSPQSPMQGCLHGRVTLHARLHGGLIHGWWHASLHWWCTQNHTHGRGQTSHTAEHGRVHGLWPQCNWQLALHAGHDSPHDACTQATTCLKPPLPRILTPPGEYNGIKWHW